MPIITEYPNPLKIRVNQHCLLKLLHIGQEITQGKGRKSPTDQHDYIGNEKRALFIAMADIRKPAYNTQSNSQSLTH